MDLWSSVAASPEATPSGRYQRRSRELRVAHARRSGDRSERAALIEEFMPLARSLARGLRTTRDSRDDLVQVACVGLVEAFDLF
jgi:RNA polymerase sigma-B factor